MIKNLLGVVLCGLAVFYPISSSWAADVTSWELSGEATSSLGLKHVGSVGSSESSTDFSFSVNGQAGYVIGMSGWEPTLATGFYLVTGDSGYTALAMLLGPTYNFNRKDIPNSFFVSGLVGFQLYSYRTAVLLADGTISTGSTTYVPFAYAATIGKRFEILGNVSWSPEFIWSGHLSATNDVGGQLSSEMNWAIVPFRLSVVF